MKFQIVKYLPVKLKLHSEYLIIIAVMIFSNCIYSQSYKPVLHKDSTSWDVAHYELFGILMNHLYCKSHPDSIYSGLYQFGAYPDTLYMGKVWEDTSTSQIWYINIYGHSEKLIFDMNLMIGDSFEIMPGQFSTVDSVFYLNGRKNIRFDLHTTMWNEKVRFIEGVGPNTSIAYLFDDYDKRYVACKYNADSLVYVNSNPIFIGCLPDLTAIDEKPFYGKIELFPNPANSILNIKLPETYSTELYEIEIYDIHGRRIMSSTHSNVTIQIDVSDFNKGLYLVKIQNNETVTIKRIIIQ